MKYSILSAAIFSAIALQSCGDTYHCTCNIGTKDTVFNYSGTITTTDGNKKCADLKAQFKEDTCILEIDKYKGFASKSSQTKKVQESPTLTMVHPSRQ